MALLSLENPGKGDATSPQYYAVGKEGDADEEEADGETDNIDFEGDRDADVALLSLNNPGEGDANSPQYDVLGKEGVRTQRRRTRGRTTSTLRVIGGRMEFASGMSQL